MSIVTVIGGTGYTGSNVVTEATARGHRVVSYSRRPADPPVDGVDYRLGAAADAAGVVPGSDVVVAALSPRGDLAGKLLAVYQDLAVAAEASGARLLVVGGFSSLRPAAGQPRFVEGDVPEEFRGEATEMESVRAWLADAAPAELDWTFVSPAAGYGAWAAGERTGRYRLGGEVASYAADGSSELSGADFAVAIVDEIEQRRHPGEHISVVS